MALFAATLKEIASRKDAKTLRESLWSLFIYFPFASFAALREI